MRPDRWKQIRRAFEAAAETTGDERAAVIEQFCGNNAELRAAVEQLLEDDLQASGFLHTGGAPMPSAPAPEDDDLTGVRVGNYRLEERIGRGGMGSVYRAHRADGSFERAVALKTVRPGLATPAALERFHAERQILADLDHPNIARLYGGGDLDGRPYFVMELVEGPTFDAYCEQRDLDIDACLAIVTTACEALGHAHASGVIHRDIKPSNILVTPQGAPKIVDFGIAENVAQADDTSAPRSVHGFTRRYASPEQVTGAPVSPATDVYSLGVMLYELIAGRPPYETDQIDLRKLRHVVCEQQPEPPAIARQRLCSEATGERPAPPRKIRRPRDLDAIVLKAMAKDPAARYPTAREFGADIASYRRGLPVEVRRGGWAHSARSLWVAHGRKIAAVALVAAVVAGATWLRSMRSPTVVGAQPVEVSVVASTPWVERDGSLSSDGEFAAYVANTGGVERIWVTALRDVDAHTLTGGFTHLEDPVWAPSDDEIAYLLFDDEGVTVHFVGLDGSTSRPPFAVGSGADDPGLVRWLGEHLYVRSVGAVWRLHVGTGELHRVTPETFPFDIHNVDVDPTETRIAFTAAGEHDVFVADLDGMAVSPAGATPSQEYLPAFHTPDHVLFISDRSGQIGVWDTDLRSGVTTNVLSDAEEATGIASSSGGGAILIETRVQQSDLWMFDLSTQRPRQVTADLLNDYTGHFVDDRSVLFHRGRRTRDSGFPVSDTAILLGSIDDLSRGEPGTPLAQGSAGRLAGDGRWLTYLQTNPESGRIELWMKDRRSDRATRLTSAYWPSAYLTAPFEWETTNAAIDATRNVVYFLTRAPGGGIGLQRVSLLAPNAPPTTIVAPRTATRLDDIHISPDGAELALRRRADGRTQALVVSASDYEGRPWHATDDDLSLTVLGWRDSDSLVAMARVPATPTWEVLALHRDGGPERLGVIEPSAGGSARYFRERDTLVFLTKTRGIFDLSVWSLDSAQPERLGLSARPDLTYAGFGLSADGRLLFSQQTNDWNLTLLRLSEGGTRN